MYCVTCWYDWDGIVCPPYGAFCFFETLEETRMKLVSILEGHAKRREYKTNTDKISKRIEHEQDNVFEISAADLFDDENDYSRFRIEWVSPGEIILI